MQIHRTTLAPHTLLGVREVVSVERLTEFFERAFPAAAAALHGARVGAVGPAMALYRAAAPGTFDVTAGFPIGARIDPPAGVEVVELPAASAITTVHEGAYDALSATYERLAEWMHDEGLTASDAMWEEYLVGPSDSADPSTWRTRVVFPIEGP